MVNKTKIIFSVVGVILFIGVLAVVLILTQKPRPADNMSNQTPRIPRTDASGVGAALQEISGGADVSRCARIGTSESADICYAMVANVQSNVAVCESISDKIVRDSCRSLILTRTVEEGGNASDCLKIENTEGRQSCVFAGFRAGTIESVFCDQFLDSERISCLNYAQFAKGSQDPSACASITDEDLRDECGSRSTEPPPLPSVPPPPPAAPVDTDGDGLTDTEEATLGTNPSSADTDGDGLNDYQEVKVWQTDPKKSDTDSDGYSDGTEVQNGFNPLGTGRL